MPDARTSRHSNNAGVCKTRDDKYLLFGAPLFDVAVEFDPIDAWEPVVKQGQRIGFGLYQLQRVKASVGDVNRETKVALDVRQVGTGIYVIVHHQDARARHCDGWGVGTKGRGKSCR
jgi:hypothetical protein